MVGKNLGTYNPLPITFNGNRRLSVCFVPDFILRIMVLDIQRREKRAGVASKLWGRTKFLSIRNRFGEDRTGSICPHLSGALNATIFSLPLITGYLHVGNMR